MIRISSLALRCRPKQREESIPSLQCDVSAFGGAAPELWRWTLKNFMKRTVAALSLLFVSSMAAAQTLGYADADNPSEAVGMMKNNVVSADVLLRECSARLPDNAAEMAAQLKTWKTTEAHAIDRSEHYYQQMVAKEPALKEQLAAAETYLMGNIALLEKTNPNNKAATVSLFCRQHFADLASGIWRQRTPRLYKFLDAAP